MFFQGKKVGRNWYIYLESCGGLFVCVNVFYDQWRIDVLVVINEENKYSGITRLSTLGKIFTTVINNRLSQWAEEYSVYIEAQAGFRSGMGTVDNIFVLHGLISHILNQGKHSYCAFVDFTKAWDYIVRDNLWAKLIKLGLRGNIL